MRIKAVFYFLLILLGANFAMAYDPYCYSICHFECAGFYAKEGITSKTDNYAIKLCVNSCMERKCQDD